MKKSTFMIWGFIWYSAAMVIEVFLHIPCLAMETTGTVLMAIGICLEDEK